MSHFCRELFPVIYTVPSIGKTVGLPMGDTNMNVSVPKDNAGALVLDRTFSPQFTPCGKWLAPPHLLWEFGYLRYY